ncbi:ABC transporter [Natrarchaeobius oligotrophus]|uniref:ABC transporter n=1 Tax=Natrarchaeobius chitinivorans TaxID=1679083 RepID=A0A3N6PHT9_NATCH|nr:ABC transporter [Natrarchaeobius chitinivorans]RQH00290.1 ABC transporter [Natrarchaeobius chitinivorans]
MSEYGRLFAAVFEKQTILLKRYWFNTLMLLVAMYIMFAMVFFGGQRIAGDGFESTLDVTVVGFFLFIAASAAYFDVARSVMEEAQWGTLEQLYMSRFGLGSVLAARTVFNILFSSGVSLVLLGLMLLTTGRSLSVDVITVFPLLVVTLLSVIGLGYVIAGLSLLYKRIENVQQLLQFVFIGLIALPSVLDGIVLGVVPLSFGSGMITSAMTEGVRLWQFPAAELIVLLANSGVYLVIGYAAFDRLVERTRDHGTLGHY